MDFYPLVLDMCTKPVAAEIRQVQGNTLQDVDLVWDLLSGRGLSDDCRTPILGYLAQYVGPGAEPDFVTAYFTHAGDLALSNTPEVRTAIGGAAARVPFKAMPQTAVSVFGALRANQIDVRSALATNFESDWSFVSPQDPTWQYHLYLAALDTPGAVSAMAEKIAATANGNDATNLLVSIATIRKPEVQELLMQHKDDPRHADAPEGPGATIAETVRMVLQRW